MKIRNSIRGLLLVPLLFVCFGLSPTARAATPEGAAIPAITPTPDGCYPGFNTAEGCNALQAINTALGQANTGLGFAALQFLTSGDNNTAVGVNCMQNLTTGIQNTAVGQGCLRNNTQNFQTAVGYQALGGNTFGPENTAVGTFALAANTTNGFSVAVGFRALDVATGGQNTAVGDNCLGNVTTGARNTAIGDVAGSNFTTCHDSIAIGTFESGSNENNRTFIGNLTNNQIQTFNGGTIKYVTSQVSNGRLGVTAVVSSRRYKHDIKPMGDVSNGILKLKPATFYVNKEWDTSGLLGFGLIAEDVEAVNPDWVFHNEDGSPESVRYDQVWACLLNEFLKEQKTVEAQQASIADLKSTVALQKKEMEVLTAQLKEQAAQIQRVSAQVELHKSAPSTVANK